MFSTVRIIISEEHKYEPLTVKDFSGNDKMINAVFELSTL